MEIRNKVKYILEQNPHDSDYKELRKLELEVKKLKLEVTKLELENKILNESRKKKSEKILIDLTLDDSDDSAGGSSDDLSNDFSDDISQLNTNKNDPNQLAKNWIKNNPPKDKEITTDYYARYQSANINKRIVKSNIFGKLVRDEGYETISSTNCRKWVRNHYQSSSPSITSENKNNADNKTNTSTYLYFICHLPYDNQVKIGISKNPSKRLAQLQTGNPNKLILYHVVISDNITQLETTLHNICKDLQRDGGKEWFRLHQSELEYLIGNF